MYVHTACCCVGIADLRDESDRDGIRMVIELKRDAVPQVHTLYAFTTHQAGCVMSAFAVTAAITSEPRSAIM
jgi:DNA gyrase subunit A